MKKPIPRKKPVAKRVAKSKKKTSVFSSKLFLIAIFLFSLLFACYHYRNALAYYFSFKSHKSDGSEKLLASRNELILSKNPDKVAGIDVSHYQGNIDWSLVKNIHDKYPIGFVFIRATTGNDKADAKYKYNWTQAKKHHFIRGAYHYYRPNENSVAQANNFINTVKLSKGDLPPVLDIEKLPKDQSIDSLKRGLRRWLEIVDKHYNVRPIIYSGESYYIDFLKEEFSDYPFWIANYNFLEEKINENWLFWQFTEKAKVAGINGNVDVNIYNGTPKMLGYLRIN